jgi:flagellin
LAVQSSTGTYNATDRASLDNEFDALNEEITRISDRTGFNDIDVLGSTATVDIQVGADTGDTISLIFKDMGAGSLGESTVATATATGTGATARVHTYADDITELQTATFTIGDNTYSQDFLTDSATTLAALGALVVAGEDDYSASSTTGTKVLNLTATATGNSAGAAKTTDHLSTDDISTATGAVAAMTRIDAALLEVSNYRADLGATSNRLTHTVDNLMSRIENTSSARSQIEDTDFASESAVLAKSQVLQQAGTAMLAQANASGQSVMSLLK